MVGPLFRVYSTAVEHARPILPHCGQWVFGPGMTMGWVLHIELLSEVGMEPSRLHGLVLALYQDLGVRFCFLFSSLLPTSGLWGVSAMSLVVFFLFPKGVVVSLSLFPFSLLGMVHVTKGCSPFSSRDFLFSYFPPF